MKRIGLVGGLGPAATIAYYRALVDLARARGAPGGDPPIVIDSLDAPTLLGMLDRGERAGAADYLAASVSRLHAAGAEIAAITANSGHAVLEEVAARSALPLVSIVDAALAETKRVGSRRPVIFGTRATMTGGFYQRRGGPLGIEVLVPEVDDQAFIHDAYVGELLRDRFLDATRTRMLSIVEKTAAAQGADAVILAGTELPLLLRDPSHRGIPILDTARLHVEALFDRASA